MLRISSLASQSGKENKALLQAHYTSRAWRPLFQWDALETADLDTVLSLIVVCWALHKYRGVKKTTDSYIRHGICHTYIHKIMAITVRRRAFTAKETGLLIGGNSHLVIYRMGNQIMPQISLAIR